MAGRIFPDIVLAQELKATDETFPREAIEDAGYNVAICGQKNFNGVGIFAKQPIEDVRTGIPGDPDDDQARYIEAFVGDLRVASIYLPNGNPAPGEKYDYKLRWMDRLFAHTRDLLRQEEALVLGGDYNVVPTDGDCYDPTAGPTTRCAGRNRERVTVPWSISADRRLPGVQRRAAHVQLLGLPGRRMAEGFRPSDRPSAAVAAGRRPAVGVRHRQGSARQAEGVGSHPRLVRDRPAGLNAYSPRGNLRSSSGGRP